MLYTVQTTDFLKNLVEVGCRSKLSDEKFVLVLADSDCLKTF